MASGASEREDALTAARAIVAVRYPDSEVALLTGSVVRDEATATSDLDLWIVTRRKDALVAWVDAALAPAGGRLFAGYLRRKEEPPDACS